MSASGINPSWRRDYFIRHRICPCTPEQECRWCDGGAAYSGDLAAIAATVAAVTERELHRAAPRTARLLDDRADQIDGGEVAS